jgi:hypothetical protein
VTCKTRVGLWLFNTTSICFAVVGWMLLAPLLAVFCACLAISRILHHWGWKP